MIKAGSRFGVLGVAIFTTALTAVLASPVRADLFVSRDSPNGTVLQYDESSGSLLADFGGGAVGGARGVLWGPDGNLYAASDGLNAILRFDKNGKFIDVFISSGGELSAPRGLAAKFDTPHLSLAAGTANQATWPAPCSGTAEGRMTPGWRLDRRVSSGPIGHGNAPRAARYVLPFVPAA